MAKSKSRKISEGHVVIRADMRKLREDMKRVQAIVRGTQAQQRQRVIRLSIDMPRLRRDLSRVQEAINKITKRVHVINFDVAAGQSARKLNALVSQTNRLRDPVKVQVTAEASEAARQLNALDSSVRSLRRGARVNVGVGGGMGEPVGPGTGNRISTAVGSGLGMFNILGPGTGRAFAGGLLGQAAFRGGALAPASAGLLFGGPAGAAGAVAGQALFGAVGAAASTAKQGVGSLAELEQLERTLEAVTKSGEKARKLLKSFNEIDLQLPVGLEEVANVGTRLVAAGLDLEKIDRATVAVLDTASVSLAGTAEGGQRIARILSEVQAKGRLLGTEIRELATLGINVEAIAQGGFGTDIRTVAERSQRGEISVEDLVDGFIKGMESFAGGALESRADTFLGAIDLFSDRFERFARDFAEPIFEPIKEVIQDLSESFDRGEFDGLMETFNELTESTSNLIKAFQIAHNAFRAMEGSNTVKFLKFVAGSFGPGLGMRVNEAAMSAAGIEKEELPALLDVINFTVKEQADFVSAKARADELLSGDVSPKKVESRLEAVFEDIERFAGRLTPDSAGGTREQFSEIAASFSGEFRSAGEVFGRAAEAAIIAMQDKETKDLGTDLATTISTLANERRRPGEAAISAFFTEGDQKGELNADALRESAQRLAEKVTIFVGEADLASGEFKEAFDRIRENRIRGGFFGAKNIEGIGRGLLSGAFTPGSGLADVVSSFVSPGPFSPSSLIPAAMGVNPAVQDFLTGLGATGLTVPGSDFSKLPLPLQRAAQQTAMADAAMEREDILEQDRLQKLESDFKEFIDAIEATLEFGMDPATARGLDITATLDKETGQIFADVTADAVNKVQSGQRADFDSAISLLQSQLSQESALEESKRQTEALEAIRDIQKNAEMDRKRNEGMIQEVKVIF